MVRDFSAITSASAATARQLIGNADALHGAHAAAHQHVGQVGGAGEVVGDAAEQGR
jgi:hypothetical protein